VTLRSRTDGSAHEIALTDADPDEIASAVASPGARVGPARPV
jgi:hypothetical protein